MHTITKPSKAILIRVAVDQAYGKWNGPCCPESGDFVYVPIPQNRTNSHGMEREYDHLVMPALQAFSERNASVVRLPDELAGRRMHLDPDFDCLSYGDTSNRGRRLRSFSEDDWLVFYSGLRSVSGGPRLVYGLIGLLVVESVRQVKDIPVSQYDRNAHTRLHQPCGTDIVVTGKPSISGRFTRYLDIGEFRSRAYRVKKPLLETWGGLTVNDGWIQRSANPPLFLEPQSFAEWLSGQGVEVVAANNLI